MLYKSSLREKLLDGFALSIDDDPYDDSGIAVTHKLYIRQIESRAEYNAILKRAYEPRGVIANGKFYLATQDSTEVVHNEILEFLHKRKLVDFRDIDYVKEIDRFLTVQVKNKKVYIGESYYPEFKAMIRQGGDGSPKYQMVLNHLSVLENIGVPYEVKFI